MPRPSLLRNGSDTIDLKADRDKGIHIFSEVISPKIKVMPRLEFELTYYKVIIQNISHYTMGTPLGTY